MVLTKEEVYNPVRGRLSHNPLFPATVPRYLLRVPNPGSALPPAPSAYLFSCPPNTRHHTHSASPPSQDFAWSRCRRIIVLCGLSFSAMSESRNT